MEHGIHCSKEKEDSFDPNASHSNLSTYASHN